MERKYIFIKFFNTFKTKIEILFTNFSNYSSKWVDVVYTKYINQNLSNQYTRTKNAEMKKFLFDCQTLCSLCLCFALCIIYT